MDGDLRWLFRQNIPSAQWTSVETGLTAAGVPDSEYCFDGGASGWVEAKKIDGWVVTLRPAQIGWLVRRARLGGTCFVAVRKGDYLWVRPGSEAREMREVGLKGCPSYAGGPRGWPWREVEKILRGFTTAPEHRYEPMRRP